MNKTAACYIFDSFQEDIDLVMEQINSDEVELLKENAQGVATSLSGLSFEGENVFPDLFRTLYNEDFYFDESFRLRVDLLIEKCRSLSDALCNFAMLLELMKLHYPKEKEVDSIDQSASA